MSLAYYKRSSRHVVLWLASFHPPSIVIHPKRNPCGPSLFAPIPASNLENSPLFPHTLQATILEGHSQIEFLNSEDENATVKIIG